MKVQTITETKYIADDGTRFNNKTDAIVRNYNIQMTSLLRNSRRSGVTGPMTTDEMASILLNNSGEIASLMKTYRKAMASIGNKKAAKKIDLIKK